MLSDILGDNDMVKHASHWQSTDTAHVQIVPTKAVTSADWAGVVQRVLNTTAVLYSTSVFVNASRNDLFLTGVCNDCNCAVEL